MMQVILRTVFILATAAAAFGAGLGDLKTVYLLPMSNGLDQHLAVRLTNAALLQVVTDPQKADAILTDHIGGDFEEKMNDLFAPKKPVDDKTDTVQTFARVRSGSHVKGTAFLVNRKTGDVIWSAYVAPNDTSQESMKRAAAQLVKELTKASQAK
jgi:hypothetical protein